MSNGAKDTIVGLGAPAAQRLQLGCTYARAALIAHQIFSEVAGICTDDAPMRARASLTALMTEDNAPTVPDSPAPFTPRGLVLVGTSFSPRINLQTPPAPATASPTNAQD